jgi:hypothetical protein
MADITDRCSKCGAKLPRPELVPAFCAKCDLINALMVERYTVYERHDDNAND